MLKLLEQNPLLIEVFEHPDYLDEINYQTEELFEYLS